jgi:putative flippase GtrA
MTAPRTRKISLLVRWLKFNAVGAVGICVQLFAVYVFGSVCALDSLWATALAVESAVLHNFFWHENFTWRDRPPISHRGVLLRLFGFNATTGAVSIAGNLLFVSLFMNQLHASLVTANLCAVAACSLINFIVNDRIVFRAAPKSRNSTRNGSALLASH